MNATAQKNEARAMTCAGPETDDSTPIVGESRPQVKRRRSVPAGAYMEPGVAGRVLVFLWSMAPWSQGPVAFVWPKLDTIATAIDLWPSQVGKALKRLRDLGWIRRETRAVRFEGRMVDRLGFVLLKEPSNGPLFDWLRREDELGEVVVESPPRVVTPTPPTVVVASLEEQETIKNSSSACAREPGEDDEDEDGYRDDKGNRLPPPPRFTPHPTPTPPPGSPPDPLPAASLPATALEAPLRSVLAAHEDDRHERLGGTRVVAPDFQAIAGARRLLAHIEHREGVTTPEALARLTVYLHELVTNAAREVRRGSERADRYVGRCGWGWWHGSLYDQVMSLADAAAVRAKSRRAREWQPDWATPTPEPDPKARESAEKMQREIDDVLAKIRAAEGRS